MKGKQDAPFSCKNDFISGVNRWITWWSVTKMHRNCFGTAVEIIVFLFSTFPAPLLSC